MKRRSTNSMVTLALGVVVFIYFALTINHGRAVAYEVLALIYSVMLTRTIKSEIIHLV